MRSRAFERVYISCAGKQYSRQVLPMKNFGYSCKLICRKSLFCEISLTKYTFLRKKKVQSQHRNIDAPLALIFGAIQLISETAWAPVRLLCVSPVAHKRSYRTRRWLRVRQIMMSPSVLNQFQFKFISKQGYIKDTYQCAALNKKYNISTIKVKCTHKLTYTWHG